MKKMSFTEIRIESPQKIVIEIKKDYQGKVVSKVKHYPTSDFFKRGKHHLNKQSGSGVYVWGFYDKGSFYPLYVGKSGNVFARFIEHYVSFRGGAYRVFDLIGIIKNSIPRTTLYVPECLDVVINTYPGIKKIVKKILTNYAFRYVITGNTNDGEKYLTQEIIKKLGAKKYRDVLLSGKGSNNTIVNVLHQFDDLDEMIKDI